MASRGNFGEKHSYLAPEFLKPKLESFLPYPGSSGNAEQRDGSNPSELDKLHIPCRRIRAYGRTLRQGAYFGKGESTSMTMRKCATLGWWRRDLSTRNM
jgi:hypothetical protein